MSKTINIAILDMYNNVPNEGMRCLKTICGRFLAEKGIEGRYDVFNVRGDFMLPGLEYDVYISSGGPGNPLLVGETWEDPYFELLSNVMKHNRTHQKKKHWFAICHSFQLIAQYFELGKISKRKSTSFGVMPIHRTESSERVFEGLHDIFYAVDSRDYQLTEPNEEAFQRLNAEILCIEKERPYVDLERAIMAVRINSEIIGVQFHPEADAEGMLRYFNTEEKKKIIVAEYGEAKYFEMIDRLDDPDKIRYTEGIILPSFLKYASMNVQKLEAI